MKVDKLGIEIHTTIKEINMLDIPTNEEILKVLKKIIDIPDTVESLTISLKLDEPPMITFTKIAEKPKDK